MKTKFFFLLLLFLGLSANLFSQDDSDESGNSKTRFVRYGLKFGLDISTSKLNSISDELKGNYQYGIFLRIGKKLYLQPEIYYSTKNYMDANGDAQKINLIKAPIMAGFQLFDIGLLSLHLKGGPVYVKELKSDNKASFKWSAGAGVDILGFITTDIRYTFKKGNSNQFDQIEDLVTNGGVVNITAGLKF